MQKLSPKQGFPQWGKCGECLAITIFATLTKYIYFRKCSQVFCFMYVGFCSICYCHVLMQNNGRFSWPKSISMKSVPFVSVSMDVCCWMILMFGFDVDTLNLDLITSREHFTFTCKRSKQFFSEIFSELTIQEMLLMKCWISMIFWTCLLFHIN